MTSTEKKRIFPLIAAIIYAGIAVYIIRNTIIYVNRWEDESITTIDIIYWIVLIGRAVTLFMKNKKAVVFAAGVNVLLDVYYLVKWFGLWNLFDFLAYAAFVVIIILAIKRNAVVKKIWFLAGTLLFVRSMIGWIQGGYFEYISATWRSLLVDIAEIVALVLAGLWLNDDIAPVADAPVNEYATFDPQRCSSTTASYDVIGGADKLKMYKELLDSGTITQEQFDAKKKQILGL